MQEVPQPTYINLEYLFNKIYEFLIDITGNFSGTSFSWLKNFMGFLAIILLVVIFYCLIRLYELREERLRLLARVDNTNKEVVPTNAKWAEVLKFMNSPNTSEWKLAIIEADLILDEMVSRMNYPGENLGERLKNISKENFRTLDNAWEAHKVRNRIAHEGSDFFVSRREAERVIGLYESVFREFDYL